MRSTCRLAFAAVAVILALPALAACGRAEAGTGTSPTAGTATEGTTRYPLTIDNCGRSEKFTAPPQRVVILNGTSVGEAESFVLLGLRNSVYANAQHYGVSDQPGMVKQITALPTRGLTMNKNFDVPAEQLLALKPDLVVSTWAGGFDAASGFATRDELARMGARTLVNPVNCAFGDPRATAAEKNANAHQSIRSSFQFLTLLGQVFDVRARARALVDRLTRQIDATTASVRGKPAVTGLIAFPGMSMMNQNGLPAVMTGGIYDDVLAHAGVHSAFAGASSDMTSTMSAEQLASARVDLLVLGAFTPGENLDQEAAKLFARYPGWPAARSKRYVKVSDGVYFGPLNALAITKIAKAAHPGAA